MRELLRALKALSDETRLRVVNVILERECCVCEVMQALNISHTRASRNLSLLYEAGLLQRRKEGLWVLYSVSQEDMLGNLFEVVNAVKKTLERDTTAAEDIERLKKAERVGPGCVRQAGKTGCVPAK